MFKSNKKPNLDYYIRYTWNSIKKMYDRNATAHDFTTVEGYVLLSINPKTGTSSMELGPQMGIEPTSVSRTLNKLENDRKFITREPNPNDGRGVIVKLTKKGKQAREITKKQVVSFNQIIGQSVAPRDLEGFYKVMDTINQLISDNKILNNEQTH